MTRTGKFTRRFPKPDPVYNSARVAMFINYIMLDGKKSTAQKILYGAFDEIKNKTEEDPINVFERAIKNVSPSMEVRSKRIGGANYQVPREVPPKRRITLAMRWILIPSRARSGVPMMKCLAEELISASNNEGESVKRRENMHKMAEANKAFAHFAK